jgi:murein DD-endopeptidase MepM/ murein hydrolase activator NlpD
MNQGVDTTPRLTRTQWGAAIALAVVVALLLLVVILPSEYPPARHPILLIQLLTGETPEHLAVPVDGVGPQHLENTWGAARSEGRHHEGIDIFAPRYTPIRSTTRGIIEKKGWNRLGGRRVTVLGPGGYHHYYAHLEEYGDFDEGDAVDVGDILGYVGDSGNAINTPTHLHYGIYRPSGGATNPYPFLVTR